MSNEPRFDDIPDEGDVSRSPAKKGMSTGAKVAIILGCVFGVCALLCCGVGGYFMYKASQAVTMDPVQIAAIQQTMLTNIDLPADYAPKMAMDFTMAGQGMKMAIYSPGAGQEPDPTQMLMLMQMKITADEAQMQQELERSGGGQQNQINVESSETKMVTIDGTERSVRFAKGKAQQGGAAVRQVSAVFPGKEGTVLLNWIVPEETWDEAAAMQLLQSIKK